MVAESSASVYIGPPIYGQLSVVSCRHSTVCQRFSNRGIAMPQPGTLCPLKGRDDGKGSDLITTIAAGVRRVFLRLTPDNVGPVDGAESLGLLCRAPQTSKKLKNSYHDQLLVCVSGPPLDTKIHWENPQKTSRHD